MQQVSVIDMLSHILKLTFKFVVFTDLTLVRV